MMLEYALTAAVASSTCHAGYAADAQIKETITKENGRKNKMNQEFKTGDLVVCIDATDSNVFGKENLLEFEAEYIIYNTTNDTPPFVQIIIEGKPVFFLASRFKQKQSAPIDKFDID